MRGRTIVQDKVTPLGDVLKSSDNHFSLIDRLINLTIECWKQGFCETTFNFTVNHGVTADGKVVDELSDPTPDTVLDKIRAIGR